MKILSLDPGRTTGWATLQFNEDKRLAQLKFGTTQDLSLLELIPQIEWADFVVYENFLVRPRQARKGTFDWDPMETPQVIGALKLLCLQHGKPIYEQSPSIKPVGYGFARIPYKKGKKGTHAHDAIAHGMFYAVKNADAKPVGV